jgi:type IV pilus assembly protein PilM
MIDLKKIVNPTKKMIGLDIGESSVKIIELEKVKGTVRVVRCAMIEANGKSAPVESDAAKIQLMRQQIAACAGGTGKEGLSCVVGISGQSVFLRFVKLPAVEKKKMDQIIRYEAQQQVPFPIEEVRWDYQLLGKFRKEERDILLVAIKQDIVRALVQAVCETGLMPEVVDVLPLSLYNCLVFNGCLTGEATLVVDTGAKTTNLIVADGSDLWIRSIPIAGNSITQCIIDDLGVGFAEAELLKIRSGISAGEGIDSQKALAAIDRGVSRLFAEISRSLGFYKSQFSGAPIKKILITGGGAQLANFDVALSERFKIPVERVDPLKRLTVALEDPSQGEKLLGNKHCFSNAVGLALRELSAPPLRINLVPQAILRQRMIVRKFAYFAASYLTVLVMLCAINIYSVKIARANAVRCGDLAAYIGHLEVLNTHATSVLDGVAVINNKMNIINQLLDARTLWMRICIEIQKVMAPNIWVENISSTLEERKVEAQRPIAPPPAARRAGEAKATGEKKTDQINVMYIEGKASGSIERDIPQFKEALEQSPLFEQVEIVSAQMEDGVISFVMKLKLEKDFLR